MTEMGIVMLSLVPMLLLVISYSLYRYFGGKDSEDVSACFFLAALLLLPVVAVILVL